MSVAIVKMTVIIHSRVTKAARVRLRPAANPIRAFEPLYCFIKQPATDTESLRAAPYNYHQVRPRQACDDKAPQPSDAEPGKGINDML